MLKNCDNCASTQVEPHDLPCRECITHEKWRPSSPNLADINEDYLLPPDPVNHPTHYTAGSIECIDAIRAALTPEEFRGYCKGNIVKYIWREKHKGGDESVKKAIWYAEKMIEEGNEK